MNKIKMIKFLSLPSRRSTLLSRCSTRYKGQSNKTEELNKILADHYGAELLKIIPDFQQSGRGSSRNRENKGGAAQEGGDESRG